MNISNLYTDFTQSLFKILKSRLGQDIQIQVRYGKLQDNFTCERFQLNSYHPILIGSNSTQIRFIPGIELSSYKKILHKYNFNNKKYKEDMVIFSKTGRYTFIENKCVEAIKRSRLVTYDIFNPRSEYDMRIIISKEKKIPVESLIVKEIIAESNRSVTEFELRNFYLNCIVIKKDDDYSYDITLEMIENDYHVEEFVETIFSTFK